MQQRKEAYASQYSGLVERQRKKFPTLSALAKIFLAIDATSAPSERLFSKASRITTRDRNCSHPRKVGKLTYISSQLEWYDEYLVENNYDEIYCKYYPKDNKE